MRSLAICLLSGGLDSTAAYKNALSRYQRVVALTINYGQRHERELESAQAVVQHFAGVGHVIADLSDIGNKLSTYSALTGDGTIPIPSGQPVGIPDTYVPLRNSILLSCAAALLESEALAMIERGHGLKRTAIVYGAHKEDWVGYPDCTTSFVTRMAGALIDGSKLWHQHHLTIRIDAPFMDLSKADVARTLTREEINLTWSCYSGGAEPCQTCPTCIARAEATRDAV